ncbi:MAG: glycoside hydrolase family 18 [Chitinophagaceae bacterium]|nr:glycoside hydrolase family 18 [Chitinophagaceae bacterium]
MKKQRFKDHLQKTLWVFSMLMMGVVQTSMAQTNVVGYFPTYENFPNLINSIDLPKLTHLNIAFANPNGSGALVVDGASNSAVTTVVNASHAKNVKVLLSIGGAGAPGSNYRTALSNSTNMTNFINSCVNYAVTYNLDGIDVDIEGDVLGSSITASQYQSFVTQLAAALHAKNKIMTAALADWFGNNVTNAAAAQFDFINIMAYDGALPGTGDAPGPHASYAFALSSYSYWHNTKGVPGSKLNIGVPFYGYGWGSYTGQQGGDSYASIVAKYPGAENVDQIGSGGNAVYYNGIPTIKQKTAYAIQNGSGIMIWELSQDATGSKSLLTAINQVVTANSNPVPDNLAKGKAVTVSSTEASTTTSTVGSNATDGSYSTRWSSLFADPQWVAVDLGGNYAVNRVKITWEAAYASAYQIQFSSNGSDWTTVKSVTGNATTTNDQTGLSGTARYVRIYGTSRATAYGYSIYELEVYGSAVQGPYNGTVAAIPGTIQAENYDLGGEGLAYHDTETANQGGAYRTDGVDVQATTDAGGGYNVGYIAAGEWLEYTTNVSTAGNYDISMRVAATAVGSTFHIELDGANITGAVAVPNTGDWQAWQTVTLKNVALTAGQKIMKIAMDGGSFNINYVTFQPSVPTVNQPPVVSISSPANNASFTTPASITITANASDVDGTVSKVDFYNGTTLLGSDATSPYSFSWTNVAVGTYSITVKATDNSAAVTTSAAVSVTISAATNVPPTVSITSPANNTSFSAPATVGITATASDADGVLSKVDFYNGTTLLGSDNTAPYSFTWANVAAGTYSITAKATDNENAVTTSSVVSIIVNTVVSDCPKLTWSDEFNGTSLDQSKWNYQTGDGCPGNCGWGNNELEYYTNSTNNVSVSGGNLALTARNQPNYNGTGRNYTSGKLVTAGKFSQKYGRYEARIKAPSAAGIWPAFWMLADNTNWPSTGEIDILECANANPSTWFGTLHYASTSGDHQSKGSTWNTSTPLSNDFHVYAVEWNTTQISWFIDGVLRGTATKAAVVAGGGAWPFDNQKFFIILNVAVGGNFSGQTPNNAQYPVSMLVDYVRVYSGDPCTVTQSPFNGTAAVIPGTIEAENYDLGGEGVSYHDLTSTNDGGAFRTDGVDLEASTDTGAGYNLGYTAAGEWTEYTVNVTAAGTYDISARVAATAAGKSLHVEMDGANISGSIAVPNTGGWQTWQTVTIKNVALTAGQKIMRIVMDTDGFNLNNVKFTASVTSPNNQAPTVSLTAPANNANYNAPAGITVSANAADTDGTVSKVDFYNGATLLSSDNTAPYSYTWTNVAAGTYTISAKATDNLGASATTSAVTIVVKTVTTPNSCAGIATYAENSGYVAGSKVQSGGRQYVCKPYPYSGWCNGAAWAYGPGTGAYWADAWTDNGSCTASVRTGEANDVNALTVFPNPATEVLNISSSDVLGAEISIVDILGTEVLHLAAMNTEAINISSLRSGMYTVIIKTNDSKVSRTFVKQ